MSKDEVFERKTYFHELNMPQYPDIVDVQELNGNMHIIDEEIAKLTGVVNIWSYKRLVTDNDWTIAIQTALDSMYHGGTLFFPPGEFRHTGFTIPARYLNIRGCGQYGTFLVNTAEGKDSITIAENSERGTIRDICIMGNGNVMYGETATCGHGIVFGLNSVSWTFQSITVRGHGKNGIHMGEFGHVNNVNILDSAIEFNKGHGIYMVATAGESQINAVNVRGCNLTYNGDSNILLFGNNVNISDNTIQASLQYGIEINSDKVPGYGDVMCGSVNIQGNYFELNRRGTIYTKADVVHSPTMTYKYIGTTRIVGNFAYELGFDPDVDTMVSARVGDGIDGLWWTAYKSITFKDNYFRALDPEIIVFDGGDALDGNSHVESQGFEDYDSEFVPFRNMGAARVVMTRKTKVLNNYFEARSDLVTFDDITTGKSSNIMEMSTVYYPYPWETYGGIMEFGTVVETDFHSCEIYLRVYARPRGSSEPYELVDTLAAGSIDEKGVMKGRTQGTYPITNGRLDVYLAFTFYVRKSEEDWETEYEPTYFHYYNPYIIMR